MVGGGNETWLILPSGRFDPSGAPSHLMWRVSGDRESAFAHAAQVFKEAGIEISEGSKAQAAKALETQAELPVGTAVVLSGATGGYVDLYRIADPV